MIKAVLGIAWAAPCTAVGLAAGAFIWASGGQVRKVGRVVEFAASSQGQQGAGLSAKLPWAAITLGHVIIGTNTQELERLRKHELVHVKQFECWGPLLLLAYPLASLAALLAGRCPYKANWFEQQAIAAERGHSNAG